MNKQTEALKLALEGLEKWHFDKDPRGAADYIAAIHDALAEQPAQRQEPAPGYCKHCKQYTIEEPLHNSHDSNKPVALRWRHPGYRWTYEDYKPNQFFGGRVEKQLLYTSPQPSKPWVGLTDEERDAILDREFKQWWSRHDAVCRAIEAKLREKNT